MPELFWCNCNPLLAERISPILVQTFPTFGPKELFMVNRRMFRPGFSDVKEPLPPRNAHPNHNGGPAPSKKPAPPEITHAENFYWIKQMQSRTPMAVVLEDGETLHGVVEWYDHDCIKLTRQGSPNLMIFKRTIKYVYKEGDGDE
jgi:sRNA-binding regulator protein Hfq